jgi:hypothetical protein
MITLANKAKRNKTFIITISFTDSEGNPVAPNVATWTLKDINGNVINNREDVDILNPLQVEEIVLSGDDLGPPTIDPPEEYFDSNRRIFSVDAEYDSITYGNDLPFGERAEFEIED